MPSEVSVLLGEDVELVCKAHGVPTPRLQWLKDGKPVASGGAGRIRYVLEESLLFKVFNSALCFKVHMNNNARFHLIAT